MTIVEFLEARLTEDEADARAADEGRLLTWSKNDHMVIVDSGFMQTFTPSRILREVAAKRAILAQEEAARSQFEHVKSSTTYPAIEVLIGQVAALATVIRHLASAYSSHPDYRQEWAL